MGRHKWHLVTELEEKGFLKLVEDLNRLYEETDRWNVEICFRIRDGKYDVNVLTKDWEAMRDRVLEYKFEKRYREDSK